MKDSVGKMYSDRCLMSEAKKHEATERVLSMVDSHLRDMVQDMIENMSIKDRKYMGKTYLECFVGAAAVQFLLNGRYAVDTDDAVHLGNLLIEQGVVHHVCDEHPFENSFLFYKFGIQDDKR